jgi:hypothetical protein
MTDTIAHLVSTSINGQHTHAEELIKEHGHTMQDVRNYMNEYGYNADHTLDVVVRLYNPLIKQMLDKH